MKISGRSFVLACWALLALVNSINAQKLEEERWDPEGLGNHRAVVSVQAEADVVWADLEWRRRDTAPGEKAIIVVDGATGEQINNVIVMNADRIAGRVAFQPATVPGDYWIYFLPYQMEGRRNYPTARYLSAQETASPQWLRQNGLEAEEVAWEDFPRAEFLRFESNESVNAFTEMERVATEAEVQGLVERFAPFGFVLIPETREHPIRMSEDLPFRWAGRQPGEPFRATAAKGEFLAFQLGVYSPTASLDEVSLEFSDLRLESGGELISASRFRCFNLGGIDWTGKPFKRPVSLAAGKVHALWLGLDVPMAVSAGDYRGMISVGTESGLQQTVPVTIEVGNQTLEDSGDSDPFRLSRLRWLDSTIALDDTVVPPYEPISVKGKKLTILGRSIELGEDGLPSGIESYFAPEMTRLQDEPRAILSSPVRMHVELSGSGKVEGWTGEGLSFEKIGKSEVSWQSRRTSGVLSLETTASLEFDGNLEFEVKVSTTEPVQLSDIWLEVPIKEDVARYMMGLGYRGGTRPDQFDWKWDPTKNQDSVWLGDVNAGLQVSWKDQNYVRPLNTNFYLLKPLQMPTSWYNGGAGGCELRHTGQNYRIRTFSGERKLQPGHPLHFKFRLLITPFKPIDPPRQWANRFYHNYEPIETIREQGANVINIHHANELNPYINYPFLSVEKLKNYIDQAHVEDLKVKIYYTVRELSNRAPEVFALRSLGDDVLAYGPGGGSSWMQEHLGANYIAGWYVPSLRDAAIINSGTSRWHNYYLEGLEWLVKNVGIDGIYIDDVAFDRVVMKRVRRILDRGRPGALIDLHSANQFNVRDGFANSANLYLEHFPFLDRLWFGEYFDYDSQPDFWMVEVAGIPFGLMGEMLEGGGNPWRGMVFGMTGRMPRVLETREMWKLWDSFGMQDSQMIGYWVPDCPVKTDREDVLATVYTKESEAMVALANWSEETVSVDLSVDWDVLGLNPENTVIESKPITGFQPRARFDPGERIPVEGKKGWMLWLHPR